jgi:PAS domain S-box-containing protein
MPSIVPAGDAATMEARARALVDAMPDLLLRIDREGRYLDFREPAGRERAVPPECVIGRHIAEVLPPDVAREAERVIRTALESGRVETMEYDMPHYEELRSFEARIVACGSDDVVVIVRDVTERKRAEAVLRRSQEELEALVQARTAELALANAALRAEVEERRQAERCLERTQGQLLQSERLASLGALLAGVAHDLNTPIAAVVSARQTLEKGLEKVKGALGARAAGCGGTAEEARASDNRSLESGIRAIESAAEVVRTGSQRVREIADRLRSFARADRAQLEKVDLNARIDETLLLVRYECKRGIEIVRDYAELEPVVCYPARIDQVVLNLVTNAFQAMGSQGQLIVRTRREGDQVSVVFEDNGAGIPAQNLARIFDPGFTTKPPGEGTGLGLAICKKVMAEHSGTIEVVSEVSKGSTFTLRFPVNLDQLPPPPCCTGL